MHLITCKKIFVGGFGYGSDSGEDEGDDDREKEDDDDYDSDVELQETIRRKKREFEQRLRDQPIYEEEDMGK